MCLSSIKVILCLFLSLPQSKYYHHREERSKEAVCLCYSQCLQDIYDLSRAGKTLQDELHCALRWRFWDLKNMLNINYFLHMYLFVLWQTFLRIYNCVLLCFSTMTKIQKKLAKVSFAQLDICYLIRNVWLF